MDGALPYRDFVMDQPPLVPLLLSPVGLLSHFIGAAGAFGAARIVTVAVEAVNVVLVGLLLRHRSVLCIVVSCTVLAVFPAAVVTSRTVLLEPYCDLFCLLGLVIAFDGGRLTATASGSPLPGRPSVPVVPARRSPSFRLWSWPASSGRSKEPCRPRST